MLMRSDLDGPTVIGGAEYVTADELIQTGSMFPAKRCN
jgi:hypothetical protein